MSARFIGYRKPSETDAVITSRRAFCLMGAASLLALAGCAAQEGAEGAGSAEQADAEGETPAEPTEPAVPADLAADSDSEEPVQLSTFAFNTLCTFTAYGVDGEALRSCAEECARFEDLFSARKEGTDVWRLNASAGEWVDLDSDTADLLRRSLELAEASEGAFDPTVGTVSLLWDFVEGVKPDHADIEEALKHVGWQNLELEGDRARLLDPETRVDLGGIAKGWISRRIADRLEQAGATAALVNLGTSSIYALGTKPGGVPWKLGLRDPRSSSTASMIATVEVVDESLTSSGLYEQQFELDGTWYWHILDPRTGYPVESDVLGDTLICADPTEGDATSTVLFVKGSAEGARWLEGSRPDLQALFMCADNTAVFLNGFADHGFAWVEA